MLLKKIRFYLKIPSFITKRSRHELTINCRCRHSPSRHHHRHCSETKHQQPRHRPYQERRQTSQIRYILYKYSQELLFLYNFHFQRHLLMLLYWLHNKYYHHSIYHLYYHMLLLLLVGNRHYHLKHFIHKKS